MHLSYIKRTKQTRPGRYFISKAIRAPDVHGVRGGSTITAAPIVTVGATYSGYKRR